MNTTLSILLLAIAPLVLGFSGCSTIGDALYDREVVEVPGQIIATNSVLHTNLVLIVEG